MVNGIGRLFRSILRVLPIGELKRRWEGNVKMDLNINVIIRGIRLAGLKIGIIEEPCGHYIELPGSINHGIRGWYNVVNMYQ